LLKVFGLAPGATPGRGLMIVLRILLNKAKPKSNRINGITRGFGNDMRQAANSGTAIYPTERLLEDMYTLCRLNEVHKGL